MHPRLEQTTGKLLTSMAQRALTMANVQPKEEWVTHMAHPPINLVDRVSIDEALDYIALNRPPGLALQRRSPSAQMVSLDDLYQHQKDAIVRTVDLSTGRVRSGVWIMPCGTGKTRAAVRAMTLNTGRSIITVPNVETAEQWAFECKLASLNGVFIVNERAVEDVGRRRRFLEDPPNVVIVTYSAMSHALRNPKVSWEARFAFLLLDYDVHVLDEAHVLPADTYEDATLNLIRAYARLAVTADITRSDGREGRIEHVVGPVLYRMTELEARLAGVATRVERMVIHMQVDDPPTERVKRILHPAKVARLVRLLRDPTHSKVLVYCDTLAALPTLARMVQKVERLTFVGVFSGATSRSARRDFLEKLRAEKLCVGILTRAGSTSLDVRDVDTVIDVDVGDASVQKLVQRAGRAQRVHEAKSVARFISIVVGEREIEFAKKREPDGVTWTVERAETVQNLNEIEGVSTSMDEKVKIDARRRRRVAAKRQKLLKKV